MPSLPPLGALRAFEAAARHGSLTAAADELSVTHGAVSQQVKLLEEWLGVSLFERKGRGVALTRAGEALAGTAHDALMSIAERVAQIRRRANPRRLTVTTMPSFAARWLTPRIGRFLEREPNIELNIRSTEAVLDLAIEGVDVAIRFGAGHYPGFDCEFLMADELLVVASPGYQGGKLPRRPQDLKDAQLLHGAGDDWGSWFAAAGVAYAAPPKGVSYTDSSHALQAAVEGAGVALTRRSLVKTDLANGRLVQLFDVVCPVAFSYWLVTQPSAREIPLVQRFRDWIVDEVAREA
ncbi:transcriptional regulator GcvA [Niveibacterium umoris]|uniref:LysR family glycine cleavage system transcriptional activator n=2 Tax=Niveibacterium umoris TaxID=1193620 RepID=A0A840BGD9_9RHOO|nr:transcriptional regulator GcvA [Niveibacterium umoris]MBB4011254.1 LysR family glycine cleavage system transcriptional activator [Niveibacterium umoris]